MITYPNAKINLGLNVVRKRADGFHDIESLFFPIPWTDILEIVPSTEGKGKVVFTSSGIDIPSNGTPNLCEQVYRLLFDEFGIPSIKMHLHKMIPIGAGLGGGSADAAFAATMLNDMFGLGLSPNRLEELVSKVGSDCPFFIRNTPAFVTGRGELLEPFDLDLSGHWIMLVNPDIHIGTKEAYSGVRPAPSKVDLCSVLSEHLSNWKGGVKNDFEESVFQNHPVLAHLKASLYASGAMYAAMTGSGSTVFGLFDSRPNWTGKENYQIKIAQL